MNKEIQPGIQDIQTQQSIWRRNKLSVKEKFEDKFIFDEIIINQSLELEPPSCVYDAAIVLAKYIEKNHPNLKGKTLIELGSGCGFTSIHIAKKLDPQYVVCTDQGSVISIIRENIEINKVTEKVECVELFWGKQEHLNAILNQEFDFVLGSDLLYDFDYFTELVETLDLLYKKNKTQIFFCFTHRFSDVERWFQNELSMKNFKFEFATESEFDEKVRDPSSIYIMKIFK